MRYTHNHTRQVDTKNHLKNTFLAMLGELSFSQIRITALCREAHVARSLFYAHYIDIYDLLDDTISTFLIQKIFLVEKKHFIPYLENAFGIAADIAENIFWFIINGSMAVNKKVGWCKNEKWHEMQLQVLRFIMFGLGGLQEKKALP